MTAQRTWLLAATLALVGAMPAAADDLTGEDEILCAGLFANRCFSNGECVTGSPETWNMPQFIEIDLENKMLRTTEASGLNRQTPIKNIERDGDMVFLQGVEMGRAFSLAVNLKSGHMTAAVAFDGIAVDAFGACTPIED